MNMLIVNEATTLYIIVCTLCTFIYLPNVAMSCVCNGPFNRLNVIIAKQIPPLRNGILTAPVCVCLECEVHGPYTCVCIPHVLVSPDRFVVS